jgi:hypothetical protein
MCGWIYDRHTSGNMTFDCKRFVFIVKKNRCYLKTCNTSFPGLEWAEIKAHSLKQKIQGKSSDVGVSSLFTCMDITIRTF